MSKFSTALAGPSLILSTAMVTLPTPAHAASGFQNTCSNISFAYDSGYATLKATCLRADGTAEQSSLALVGISNQNGILTVGQGVSTFQKSCGNIQINATLSSVTLTAICRNSSGYSVNASVPLNNIGNNNGMLTY